MKQSWTFWLQWRLLIKAKYWSFSSLLSPPPWFPSLYCWPPEENRARSLDGRSANKWRITGTVSAGDREWACVFMCVFFGQAPSHPIWISSELHSSTVSVSLPCHIAWRIRLGLPGSRGPFSLLYTKTHYTHFHTHRSTIFSSCPSLSLYCWGPRPCSAAVFRVMRYRLMLFRISLCYFSSAAERMQAGTHHFSFHRWCSKLLYDFTLLLQ